MRKWLRRIRAAIGTGFIWALGGLLLGGVVELIDNVLPVAHPLTRLVDMWPQTLALLAFPCGVVFAVVVGIVGRHRRFEEFSLPQFASLGALAGLVFGVVAMALGAGVVFTAGVTLLSAVAGAGSLALARRAKAWGLPGAGPDVSDARLTAGRAREILGRGD